MKKNKEKYKVGIVGCGFVGTAVSVGFETLLKDKVDIREHDKFKPSESLKSVVDNSDIIFLCLPTPMSENGSCDTSIVEEICFDIDKLAEERKSLVIKSTIPPGTTQAIFDSLGGRHDVMFSPEFLTAKNFINDFLNQDRIFIGSAKGCDNFGVAKVLKLFEDFAKTQKKPAFVGEMSTAESAECLKYATNCFLAVKLSYFNELYDICNAAGLDFEEIRQSMLFDERIGKTHTNVPGEDGLRAFGGLCIPKDLNAFIAFAKDLDVDTLMMESSWAKNLLLREVYDWENIPGATTKSMKLYEK